MADSLASWGADPGATWQALQKPLDPATEAKVAKQVKRHLLSLSRSPHISA